MSLRRIPDEPICVGADTVCQLLTSIGWHVSAGLVQQLSSAARLERECTDRYQRLYTEALQRLHRYEPPPAPLEPVSYRPEARASD